MPDVSTAWVFPGQGSQESGMGRDLYEAYAVARELYDRADSVLDRPLSRLCFDGPDGELSKTTNAQPAIYVTSLACLAVAREAAALPHAPAFVAGHSLGEYTALAAAGAVGFDDGLRLVEQRGKLTQAAADATPGGLAAVLGLDDATAEAVCAAAGAEVCNINSPGQLVIGGSKDAVAKACALAVERGARRAIPLDVGGAFHTSLMAPAAAGMREAVDAIEVRAPAIPVVANDRGSAITDPAEIRTELVYQLTHPVRWVQCVEYMGQHGVTEFIEIGPGRVLTGLIKRIAKDAHVRNINGVASLST
ncbi:MAG: ACP S-malonyltransferase [Chloroflexi bacterium]|nr:ACP S-malonyltransferase [Chloroflexota bacterium]